MLPILALRLQEYPKKQADEVQKALMSTQEHLARELVPLRRAPVQSLAEMPEPSVAARVLVAFPGDAPSSASALSMIENGMLA